MQLSIIIPVLDEPDINTLIQDLQNRIPGERSEIIVVDGDDSGSTLDRITCPGVIKLTSPKGRARQQNQGAAAARGGILLFLHADTRLPHHFYTLIQSTIRSGSCGGAFDLEIDNPHPLVKLIENIARKRSRITGIPYGDQAIFMTRALFHRINGFPDIPLMEDVALMQKIRRTHRQFSMLTARAVTSARMWEKRGIVLTMFRNPLLLMLFFLGVSPRILARLYYG